MRAFLPTDTHVRALLAPVLVFVACCIQRQYQTDLWHHLARGRVMAHEGRLLDVDRFSYTVEGDTFVDVNWLTQLGFYRVYQFGGLELLQVVNALLLAGMMGLLMALAYRASRNMVIAGGMGVFIFLGLWQLFLIRPQTLSLLLFVVLLFLLEEARHRPRLLLLVPLPLVLWVNCHGAFPIGVVLVGCHVLAVLLESAWERRWGMVRDARVWLWSACLLATVLATLVNPYGLDVYRYVAQTSGRAGARRIDEWLPPGLDTLTAKVWAASLVGLVVLLALPGKRPAVHQVILLVVFLPLSCGGVRMIAWWLLILAPIAADLLAARLRPVSSSPAKESSALGAGLTCLALLALALLSLPWLENSSPLMRLVRSPHRDEHDLEQAAQRLRHDSPRGRIFTRFDWGEYLGWSLGPDFKVYMDARIEIYPDEVWRNYDAITRGKANWDQLLMAHPRPRDVPLYLILDRGEFHGFLGELVRSRSDVWEQMGEPIGKLVVYRRRDSSR